MLEVKEFGTMTKFLGMIVYDKNMGTHLSKDSAYESLSSLMDKS